MLAREAKPAEIDRLISLYERERAGDRHDERAWTMVANVLLNLDETVTKE